MKPTGRPYVGSCELYAEVQRTMQPAACQDDKIINNKKMIRLNCFFKANDDEQ